VTYPTIAARRTNSTIFNATVGWWWADPLAALAIAALAAIEGREAWRGEACDDCC
jgi:divalent metal cation (Fe/Co/Zn/Cd) transporter